MNPQCLHCERSNVPLFEEWGRWRIFCGKECQKEYQLIQSSEFLQLYQRRIPQLMFWTILFNTYKNTIPIDEIVSDFSDIMNLNAQQTDEQNQYMKDCLYFILMEEQGIKLLYNLFRISKVEFARNLFDAACRLDKLNFALAMVEVSNRYLKEFFITRDAFLTAIVYQRADFLDNFIRETHINKLDKLCWQWATFFGDEKTIRIARSGYEEQIGDNIKIDLIRGDPLEYAIEKTDHDDLVKILLREYVPEDMHIILACKLGRVKIVNVLLLDGRADPAGDNNIAIRDASYYGGFNIVKLLLQDARVDPATGDNLPIRFASENGHLEVVKLLLQDRRVDPTADNNYAIRMAFFYNKINIIKLLLSDKRVEAKLSEDLLNRIYDKYGMDEDVKQLVKLIRITKSRGEEQEGGESTLKRLKNKIKLFY